MMITVVVVMCHQLANIAAPVCHEEIVVQDDMPMQACLLAWPPAIADWKSKSKYAGDQWTVAKIRCIPGNYELRDAT
jgi:hypothetical protein